MRKGVNMMGVGRPLDLECQHLSGRRMEHHILESMHVLQNDGNISNSHRDYLKRASIAQIWGK